MEKIQGDGQSDGQRNGQGGHRKRHRERTLQYLSILSTYFHFKYEFSILISWPFLNHSNFPTAKDWIFLGT